MAGYASYPSAATATRLRLCSSLEIQSLQLGLSFGHVNMQYVSTTSKYYICIATVRLTALSTGDLEFTNEKKNTQNMLYELSETKWRIYASLKVIIDSNDSLVPNKWHDIRANNVFFLLIGHYWTYLCEIYIEIQQFSLKKMHLDMPSQKWQPFCLGLNVKRQRVRNMQNMLVFVSILQQRKVYCDVAKYFQSTSVPGKELLWCDVLTLNMSNWYIKIISRQ